MQTISKMSTTTKILLAAGLGVGAYFVAKSFKKAPEKKAIPAIAPTGYPTSGGLPPTGVLPEGRRPPGPPATRYDGALQDVEPGMVNAYHAQWLAGSLNDRLAQLGDLTENQIINALTDWAYKEVYGIEVFPIPPGWERSPAWAPYAQAWQRMRGLMKTMVNQTFAQQQEVS